MALIWGRQIEGSGRFGPYRVAMTSVQTNGITIEFEERGSGEPLLLVMGLSGQLIDWPAGFVDELVDQGFRVIMTDNRDSGLSTETSGEPPTRSALAKAILLRRRPDSEYLLADMAADEIGVLDALGIPSAHVVGMSMGGMIAQTLAIEYPERVRSLTSIMSTTGDPKVGRPTFRLMRKAIRRDPPTPENAVDSAVGWFCEICGPTFDEHEFRALAAAAVERSFRPEGTARQLAAILASPDRTEALHRLDLPTLVIHGLADPLVKPTGGAATARAVPGARLLMFPEMGHDLPPTRWAEMAMEIKANAARSRIVESV